VGTLRIVLADRQWGAKFKRGQKRNFQQVQSALRATARDMAKEIKSRGDEDITSAGNFGSRWTRGFKSKVVVEDSDFTVKTTHDVSYFSVFEFGKVIHGKPLLWIPLSFATDAQGVLARNFPGGLFRVDRKRGGAPLLLSIRDGEPKYFGKRFVRIPQKFHIRQICRDVASKVKTIYKRNFKGG
jgi:hypothetical protein